MMNYSIKSFFFFSYSRIRIYVFTHFSTFIFVYLLFFLLLYLQVTFVQLRKLTVYIAYVASLTPNSLPTGIEETHKHILLTC